MSQVPRSGRPDRGSGSPRLRGRDSRPDKCLTFSPPVSVCCQLRERGVLDPRRQTLQETSDLLGVSRSACDRCCGSWVAETGNQLSSLVPVLREYIERHPGALVSRRLGGPGYRDIGEALGLTLWQVLDAWRVLGMDPLGPQRQTDVERREARRRSRRQAYRRTTQAAQPKYPIRGGIRSARTKETATPRAGNEDLSRWPPPERADPRARGSLAGHGRPIPAPACSLIVS